jgi:hypothetical protein
MIATVLPAVLVDLANTDRSENQLGTLTVNPKLVKAAEAKAHDMVTNGYFAHNSPAGISPWYWIMAAGYDFAYAGENLAVNFDDSAVVNTAWMNSPTHRANLLNGKFTEIGVATAEGIYKGEPTIFVVQMFGTPAEPKPVPSNVPVITESRPQEKIARAKLEPIPSAQVLGESATNTFAAVKNADVVPASTTIAASIKEGNKTAAIEKYSSSPTKTLALIYFAIALILTIAFFAVLIVRHDQRNRHLAFALSLLVILFSAYYIYQYCLLSRIEVI